MIGQWRGNLKNATGGMRKTKGAGMKMKPAGNVLTVEKGLSPAVFPIAQNGGAKGHGMNP